MIFILEEGHLFSYLIDYIIYNTFSIKWSMFKYHIMLI